MCYVADLKGFPGMYFNSGYSLAGNIITLKKYENSLAYGYKKTKSEPCTALIPKIIQDSQKKSANRAKSNLRDLINSNFGALPRVQRNGRKGLRFVTLTFAENLQDRNEANEYLHKFIKRLQYFLQEDIKYVCVPEKQKRGAIHYHILIYCSFIHWKDLLSLWTNKKDGSAWINRIKDIHNVGSYVAKYLEKQGEINETGKKRFFSSHGMKDATKRYRVLTGQSINEQSCNVTFYLNEFIREEKNFAYDGEFTGKTQVRVFSLRGHYQRSLETFSEILRLLSLQEMEISPQDLLPYK